MDRPVAALPVLTSAQATKSTAAVLLDNGFEVFLVALILFPLMMKLRHHQFVQPEGRKAWVTRTGRGAWGRRGFVLSVEVALEQLDYLNRCKKLVLFGLFFASYTVLTTLRIDWWKGGQTLKWLDVAHDTARMQPIDKAQTVGEIANTLEADIADVIAQLKSICTICGVGVTAHEEDLAFLGLKDFVCSDFDSLEGVASYPPRDCMEADAVWASNPSSNSAPCCGNATLVTASIAMMVEALVYGQTTMELGTLLSGGSDPSFSSTEYFVAHNIDVHKFVTQLVVSQKGRMAAVQYHASWYDREHVPGRVDPTTTYWSFNYQGNRVMDTLSYAILALAALTLMHDHHALMWTVVSCSSGANQLLEQALDSTYVTAIEMPSVVLPLALEGFRPFMKLPTWVFWVTVCQMLMIVRLFQDATVIPQVMHRPAFTPWAAHKPR